MSDKIKKPKLGSKEHIAGSAAAIGAGVYFVNKKPKPKGLKAPTAKSIAKVESRLTNRHAVMSVAAQHESVEGSDKTKKGYSPKQGKIVNEKVFSQKRMNQINKSFLTGKPVTKQTPITRNSLMDKRFAEHGNVMRRIGAAMDSPKNKAIRTMGKVLNVVRGGSAIGALSYAASSTPVGDATIHKGFKQKAFKKSDRPLKLPK
tara:strand:+ start:713 stop:1321 length:609 start_codon:yes stop_codon:yes gene_type:complete